MDLRREGEAVTKPLSERIRDVAENAGMAESVAGEELFRIAAELEALRERMYAEHFNEAGTPMWIRGQVCEWADQLAPKEGEAISDRSPQPEE
jgi:hypothetical protein